MISRKEDADTETKKSADGTAAFRDIVFELRLGERRLAAGLAIKGYAHLLTEEPFKTFIDSLPQPLTPAIVEEQRKWLVTYFRNKGYLHALVHHELQPRGSKKKQTGDRSYILVWHIDTKGGPVRFGRTSIVGLHRVQPHTVLRELSYKEGDIWDREKVEQSIKRLRRLGAFESVAIEQAEAQELHLQPLIIKCLEDDPFEIRTRFGVQFVSKSFTHISWSTYKLAAHSYGKIPQELQIN